MAHNGRRQISDRATNAARALTAYACRWESEHGVVPLARRRSHDQAMSGRSRTMDVMIVDVSLISFLVLVISLMVIPERRSTAAMTETVATAS
jgi:hypothetical protein